MNGEENCSYTLKLQSVRRASINICAVCNDPAKLKVCEIKSGGTLYFVGVHSTAQYRVFHGI